MGACLAQAVHQVGYAASTLCGRSKTSHSTTIAARSCAEALCATVWQVSHHGEVLFNTDMLAINQDVTPQGRPVVANSSTVWARFLSDGSVAVALYNENDSAASIGLDFAALGAMTPAPVESAATWGPTTKAAMRDLWTHTANGTVTGKIPAMTVLPHQTIVVRLTKQ